MEENKELDNEQGISIWGYFFELLVLFFSSIALGCGFGLTFVATVCKYTDATIVIKAEPKRKAIEIETDVPLEKVEPDTEEPLPEAPPTVPETPEGLDELTALHMLGIDSEEKVPVPQPEPRKKDDIVRLIPHQNASIYEDHGKSKNLK